MINIGEGIYFSSKIEDMNTTLIYTFIKKSYWGKSRGYKEQEDAMKNSMNFGLFKNGEQIGYARVITDTVFFAYLLDVFIIEDEQGKGYSKLFMDEILNDSVIKNVSKWLLTTADAHGLYKKFDFKAIENPEKLMERKMTKN